MYSGVVLGGISHVICKHTHVVKLLSVCLIYHLSYSRLQF